ncbi:hypothetical protein [Cohnella panacarvi]|uniref:hypothetical protein n=1 Tax=Cohnella panacarvi TaxID=400776 RepID=UPI00047C5335|nr:hypothetical protein [Cohnella panacarvi]
MSNNVLYSTDNILIVANKAKRHVQLELSTSGYRPKFVTHYIESRAELDELIAALERARAHLDFDEAG